MSNQMLASQIFVITGPSGVGKGLICQHLLAADENFQLSVSATSRPMRSGEVDGVHYHFKVPQEFEAWIQHDAQETDVTRHQLLEWAQYNGHYYGTPRAALHEATQNGKRVLLEIETQGALQVKHKFPEACLVFIEPPSFEELERRLRARATETEAVILQRLRIAEQELALTDHFDHVVTNDRIEDCLARLNEIFQRKMVERRSISK